MSQMRESVGTSMKGSIWAVVGSGMTSISLALIGCQPRMLDPSKPNPSSKASIVSSSTGTEKCCHIPGKSMNFRSTISTFFSLTSFKTSEGFIFTFLLGWGLDGAGHALPCPGG